MQFATEGESMQPARLNGWFVLEYFKTMFIFPQSKLAESGIRVNDVHEPHALPPVAAQICATKIPEFSILLKLDKPV